MERAMHHGIPSVEAGRLAVLLDTPSCGEKQPIMRFLYFERMIILYYLLLAVARSRSDMKRIHDTLMPENCRLLRHDFREVERIWLGLYPEGKRPSGGTRVDDDVLAVMFLSLYGMDGVGLKPGLTHYYREALYKGRDCLDTSAGYDLYANRVYTTRDDAEAGHRPSCFVGYIFHKKPSEVEIQLSDDRTRLGARFYFWQLQLTEPFTRALLALKPTFRGMPLTMSGEGGYQLALCWELPADSFLPLLEETTAQPQQPLWPSFIARPGFVETLNKGLGDLGLPVKVIEIKREDG